MAADEGEHGPSATGPVPDGGPDAHGAASADPGRLVPLAETTEAIGELDPMVADDDLLEQLVAAGDRVRQVVPDCIGLSLTLRNEAVTFTLVASDEQVAMLDAVQYLAGGPAVDASSSGAVIDLHTRQRLDWPLFADASRRFGVACTVSVPLRDEGRGAAGVNLYGASPGCFDGHHDALADIFGSLADEVVVDADLAFSTRLAALEAPRILREAMTIDVAEGLFSSSLGLDAPRARQRLDEAAARAGISPVAVARLVIAVLQDGTDR